MNRVLETLEQIGIRRATAEVYLAALALGTANAEEIARRVGVPRTTAHEALQRLRARGLVSVSVEGRRQRYTAAHPDRLRRMLEEHTRALETVLPEIVALRRTEKTRPRVALFEGIEGVKTVFEDTLTTREPFLRGILSMADLYKMPGKDYVNDYTQRRIETGVALRVIRSEATEVEKVWQTSAKDQRTLHLAPAGMTFPMTMYIYDGKVGIVGTERERFGMIITSQDLYANMKNFFDVLWQVTRVGKATE